MPPQRGSAPGIAWAGTEHPRGDFSPAGGIAHGLVGQAPSVATRIIVADDIGYACTCRCLAATHKLRSLPDHLGKVTTGITCGRGAAWILTVVVPLLLIDPILGGLGSRLRPWKTSPSPA